MQNAFLGVIGHTAQVTLLSRVLARGATAHAYAFSGPAGLGKRTLALRFAEALLGTTAEELPRHPDFLHVTPHALDGYGIDDIRDACERLTRTAFFGTNVALIEDVHTLRHDAQNALLKTLEEPSGNTVVILLADDASRVLPTILSRTVHLPFGNVPPDVIARGLEDVGIASTDAHRLALAADGKPGRAFALRDPEAWQAHTALAAEVATFLGLPSDARLMKVGALVKSDDAFDRDRWLSALARELRVRLAGDGDPAPLRALLHASDSLRDNGNPTLALEHVALNVEHSSR